MMGMGLSLGVEIRLECKTCGQVIDAERAKTTKIEAALCGEVFYAVCPRCRQEVGQARARSTRWRRTWLADLVGRLANGSLIEVDARLTVLGQTLARQGGYVPYARCRWRRAACEFISFPIVEGGKLMILAREVDKPWTMTHLPIEEVVPADTSKRPGIAGLFHGGFPPARIDCATGNVAFVGGDA